MLEFSDANPVFTWCDTDGQLEGTRYIDRTWTLTDQCGNVQTHVQRITLKDEIAPTGSANYVEVDCAIYRAPLTRCSVRSTRTTTAILKWR